MDWDEFIFSRLFFASPEVALDQEVAKLLVKKGIISQNDLDLIRKLGKQYNWKPLKGEKLLKRLLAVSPELFSTTTVDALRRFNLITIQQGHQLRIMMRAANALFPAGPNDMTSISQRLVRAGQAVISNEFVSILRIIDQARIEEWRVNVRGMEYRLSPEQAKAYRKMVDASVARAELLRDDFVMARAAAERISGVYSAAQSQSTKIGVIYTVLEGLFSDEILSAMVRMGTISPHMAEVLTDVSDAGLNVWRKTETALGQEAWQARALLISEGILSPETIQALYTLGIVDDKFKAVALPAVTAIRSITRDVLKNYMKSSRVRQMPGETLLKAYGRVSGTTDRELLKLLAAAARDASKEASALAGQAGAGKKIASDQRRVVARSLHLQMRALYENVGHLTIFGEREVARLAISSMNDLTKIYSEDPDKERLVKMMLQKQAESGVDSYVSRRETLRPLSLRIYKNIDWATGRLNNEIDKAMLRGLNQRDFARKISDVISPKAPGGVSYNAMRLARTEINNAYHQTAIRHTIDMPWVNAYKWNLSGSHKHVDVCNDMASKNHAGLGRGVYRKRDVPGKPHPHCFCFITPKDDDSKTFYRNLRSGNYDRFLNDLAKRHPGFTTADYAGETLWNAAERRAMSKLTGELATIAGTLAATAAINIGVKWLETGEFPWSRAATKADYENSKIIGPGANPRLLEGPKKPPVPPTPEWDEADFPELGADADLYHESLRNGTVRGIPDKHGIGGDFYDPALERYGSATYLATNSLLRAGGGDVLEAEKLYDEFLGFYDFRMKSKAIQAEWARVWDTWDDTGKTGFARAEALDDAWMNSGFYDVGDNSFMEWMEWAEGKMGERELDIFFTDEIEPFARKMGFTDFRDAGFHKLWDRLAMMASEDHSSLAYNWSGEGKRPDHNIYFNIPNYYRILEEASGELKKNTSVFRISGRNWMGLSADEFYNDGGTPNLERVLGHRFVDDSHTSVEWKPNYYNGEDGGITKIGREFRYKILMPPGVRATVGNHAENEWILSPGTIYEILQIKETEGLLAEEGFLYDVLLAVVGQRKVE